MGTTGTVNGTIVKITVGGTAIDVQLSATLSISHDPRTGINKDSDGWEESRAGKKSWEMSGEAEFTFDATTGMSELFASMIAGTEVAVEFTSAITDDKKYAGNAQVTKLEASAGVEEDVKYSYAFKGNGPIVESVII